MGSHILRVVFLLIVFSVMDIHAEDNTVATTEVDTQEKKSNDDSTIQKTPEELTPDDSIPDIFDPTEKIIEDISYELPIDI